MYEMYTFALKTTNNVVAPLVGARLYTKKGLNTCKYSKKKHINTISTLTSAGALAPTGVNSFPKAWWQRWQNSKLPINRPTVTRRSRQNYRHNYPASSYVPPPSNTYRVSRRWWHRMSK